MTTEELEYCLAKQLPRAHSVWTDYGDFELDEELRAAIEKSLRPIIQRRIRALSKEQSHV
jgi:hypothetical protein